MDTNKFLEKVTSELVAIGSATTNVSLDTSGNFARLKAAGDKGSERSITYWIRLDGRPNAYIENHRTGIKVNVESDVDNKLTPNERACLASQAAENQRSRMQMEEQQGSEAASQSCVEFETGSKDLVREHAQIIAKKISEETQALLRVNDRGMLIIPFYRFPTQTCPWQIQTLCYVTSENVKRFKSKGIKKGTFFPIGKFKKAGVIAVTESYANGDVIHRAMNGDWAVLVSGSAHSLREIAEKAISFWPNKQVVIVGDNDFSKEKNVGREAAEQAGFELNIPVILPDFDSTDKTANGKPPSDIWDLFYLNGFDESAIRSVLLPAIDRGPTDNLNGISLSLVTPRQQEWLWPGVLPFAELSIVGGPPGCGKSQIMAATTATVTKGGAWPANSGKCEKGGVILLDAEDSIEKTIVPRLMAAGADLSHVFCMTGYQCRNNMGDETRRSIDLRWDLPAIAERIKYLSTTGVIVRLVILDPLPSYMSVDANNNTEVRTQLEALARFAEKQNVSVVGIMHTNKSVFGVGGNPLEKIAGAGAFGQVPRAAWMVLKDEHEPEIRYFLPLKLNTAADTSGFTGQIKGEKLELECGPIDTSRFVFSADRSKKTLAELLSNRPAKKETKEQRVVEYMRARLIDAPTDVEDIMKECKDGEDATRSIVYRAKSRVETNPPFGYQFRSYRDSTGSQKWVLVLSDSTANHGENKQ